jgi:chemotaxis protein CheZ
MADTAAALETLVAHEPDLLGQLASLTHNLRSALDRFRLDPRLTALADKEIPDARQRLSHVLKLTEAAAHRTLDLVEQSGPPADRIAKEAASLTGPWERFRAGKIGVADYLDLLKRIDSFLAAARTDSEMVRTNLAEVLLAQDYQDLTGQIIRGVMNLVAEVEVVLVDLTHLTGRDGRAEAQGATDSNRGHGPTIPGVSQSAATVNGQAELDALLSDLGM